MIIGECEHLCKSRGVSGLLVWSIQVGVNTMPRRKAIISDLRESFVAAHQSGNGYEAISAVSLPVRLYSAQRNCKYTRAVGLYRSQ